jgi:hypothetical protein
MLEINISVYTAINFRLYESPQPVLGIIPEYLYCTTRFRYI